jgi:hypothetical protein
VEKAKEQRTVNLKHNLGKDRNGKIEKHKGGYMEVVGEENGEEIFNIVEVEGED